jgi:4-hydroxybenzoate polyprenyltransferase
MNGQTATLTANRWWIYQRERFPVLGHGPLIAAFSFSAVSFSFLLRGGSGFPEAGAIVVAFLTAFIFFLQLRIADEFKDFADDSRYRPYRPVPRGVVKLAELRAIAIAGALVQLGLALWWAGTRSTASHSLIQARDAVERDPAMVPFGLPALLLLVWLYLALMTREFFVRDWIRVRPITYLWTHMLIIPLVDFYATACEWMGARGSPPPGLFWFLVVSFFNGVVLELGRKIRAPCDEEEGVPTYSALWGRRTAVLVWLGAMSTTAFCAWRAALKIHFVIPVILVLCLLLVVASWIAWKFLHEPLTKRAKLFEPFSGLWTLLMYLTLGAVPLLLRAWK